MSTCPITRNHLRELKSIRDKLVNKCAEWQRVQKEQKAGIYYGMKPLSMGINPSNQISKLSRQITALNETIKYLEKVPEIEIILQWCRDSAPLEVSDRAYKLLDK